MNNETSNKVQEIDLCCHSGELTVEQGRPPHGESQTHVVRRECSNTGKERGAQEAYKRMTNGKERQVLYKNNCEGERVFGLV